MVSGHWRPCDITVAATRTVRTVGAPSAVRPLLAGSRLRGRVHRLIIRRIDTRPPQAAASAFNASNKTIVDPSGLVIITRNRQNNGRNPALNQPRPCGLAFNYATRAL
jgi:hypothetical protein